ncbi:MAG: MFS transporter, partial [Planctomycetes bacterium]|nr:MFS transporter [Planctomycetota bacterium]
AGMVIGRAVVRDAFGLDGSARMFSMMAVVQAIGPIAAPLLGGYVVMYMGWRAIFGLLCLLGAASFLGVLVILPESLPAAKRVPLNVRGVADAFGSLFRNRRFMVPCLAGGIAGASLYAFIGGSPFVLMPMYGMSATQYGWWFAMIAVGMGCGGQVGRVILRRTTPHRLLVAGVAFSTVFGGIVLLATLVYGMPPFWLFFTPLMLSLATCPIITANSQAIAMSESGENAGCGSSLIGGGGVRDWRHHHRLDRASS